MHLFIGNKVYSSWSLRPWILMRAKDIACDETVVNLGDAGSSRAHLKQYSPSGKVPCLVDGTTTVWETLAIMEYLSEKFPDKHIWPKDAAARAHARAIASEMHAGFQALRKACPMVVTQRFAPKPLAADVHSDVTRLRAIWNEARSKFTDRSLPPFLYGEFTAADAMYAPVATRLRSYGITIDPVSQAYVDAVLGHPAYRAWLDGAIAETWVLKQNESDTLIDDLRA